ncbi:MAG: STAS domain-containing protein [Candidatus Eisenbacteria bacterium]|uniref:Anti-sigma factor antagonist n=1 Tax=Eiseniibacteriota bacterium TaxID=2212470 RepID=A0A538U2V1_UNCEI|nr:MAG: STAS domain-containing protein [Candidatus Eisenbacteria bacterium]
MPDSFEIVEGPATDQVLVLRVSGRLDSTTAPQLAERCAAAAESGRRLLLNLESVSFIASSGVGALLATAERYREAGSSLHLVALSPSVESVIRLLNLDAFLNVHATEAGALGESKAA